MKHPRITPDSPVEVVTPPSDRRRGSAMLAAILFTFVFGIISAWTILATQRQMRATWQARIFENSLNASASQLRNMFQQAEYIIKTRPPQFQGQLTNINPTVSAILPPPLAGFRQVNDGQNRPLSFVRGLGANDLNFETVDVAPGDTGYDTLKNWNGFQLARLSYEMYATLSEDSVTATRLGFQGASVRKEISFLYVPLYQYAIFYDNDLELHNGPQMDIRGRVHTNKNLFLNASNRLTFWDKVTAVQSLNSYNDFTRLNVNRPNSNSGINADQWPNLMRLESYNNYGSVNFPNAASTLSRNQINTGAWGSFSSQFVNMVVATGDSRDTNTNRAIDSGDSGFSSVSAALWGDQVRDSSRGVNPVKLPIPPEALAQVNDPNQVILSRVLPTDSDDVKKTKYEAAADLKILGDPGDPASIVIRDKDNNILPNVYTRSNGTTASIWSIGEFFDGQQGTVVKTIKIDMANTRERFQNTFSLGNGVMYVSSTPVPANGETWTNKASALDWRLNGRNDYMPAVQIVNATNLPRNTDSAFTIATDRPLYQAGNFNTTNKATAVMAADAITITTQELTLEVLNPTNGAVIQAGNTREGIPGAANATARTHRVNPGNANGTLTTNAILVMGNTPTKYKDPAVALPAALPANATAAQKTAYQTALNAAIKSTKDGANWQRVQQSGGAHNVIRYLESMGTHNFTGSMLVLFESRYATNGWFNQTMAGPGGINLTSYYGPPTRDYRWDSALATAAPPKGMLFLLVVESGNLERISPLTANEIRYNPGNGNTIY